MNRNHYPRDRDNGRERSRGNQDFLQRPGLRDEWTRRHAMHRDVQGPSRPWSAGGEYLRDTPVHREGRPDVEFEYAHSGDYADDVVGGDYIRGYGDMHGGQPGPDLYSEDRDARPEDYSRAGDYAPVRSRNMRGSRNDGESGDTRRTPNPAEYNRTGSLYGTGAYGAMYGEHYRRDDGFSARGHRGKGPKGYMRSDERIREDLNERFTDDDSIDPSEISIEVNGGIVTLAGSVEQRWMKHRAEDIAEACSGVKDVVNQVRVDHGKRAP